VALLGSLVALIVIPGRERATAPETVPTRPEAVPA
jgi:hypothetical protein